MSRPIRIGTRGSDLALWQARYVQSRLDADGHPTEIRIISTLGDREQELSLDKMEGKGFFVKEIEAALVSREVDIAVHSHKDLETSSAEGLVIAAVSSRANPCDVLLCRPEAKSDDHFLGLRNGAVVGTSSSRRKAQLRHYRPDIVLKDIRGNVPTRVAKLREGQFDAILLAAAGLDRLDLRLSDLIRGDLDPSVFVPAPAQGVLAIQCREEDQHIRNILTCVHDPGVATMVHIERSVLKAMEGGCHLPLGVFAEQVGEEWDVQVAVAEAWDSPLRRLSFTGDEPESLIELIVRQLRPQ